MEPVSVMLPKPPGNSEPDIDLQIINAISEEIWSIALEKNLDLSRDHIMAETIIQFNEQMKNDNPNIVVTIKQTTNELLSEYDGVSREFLIVELKSRPEGRKSYSEMALHNPFF